jgi:hypothetical protein
VPFNGILSRRYEGLMKWRDGYVWTYWTMLTIGFLETQIDAAGVRMRRLTGLEFAMAPSAHELDMLDESTARHEQRVAHLLESKETLDKRHAELIEFRHVLRETASFFNVSVTWGSLMPGWWDC